MASHVKGIDRLLVRQDAHAGRAVTAMLQEHLSDMNQLSPPESVHALDEEELRSPNITFWSAWEDDELFGCGALKELDPTSGEVKAMRTAQAHRGKGVASEILKHIIKDANRRGYHRLHLETGSTQEFEPSRVFMTKAL
jgi:putative acetyltransferase